MHGVYYSQFVILNPQLVIFQLGIGDFFSDSALPDSYIPNPQLDILSPIEDLRSPFGYNMPNWVIVC